MRDPGCFLKASIDEILEICKIANLNRSLSVYTDRITTLGHQVNAILAWRLS